MNIGKTVFSRAIDFLPMHEFCKCVHRYEGNYKVKNLSCFDQFLCMAFAQLTDRESLRDIEACLRSMQEKVYHMGMRDKVSRSTRAYAKENRGWRIYADFAQVLIHRARTSALIYKSRWQIELFFKWIKQRLRIKAFYGTSENSVKSQIWIVISVYVLVAIIKKRLKLDMSLYTILQIF